VSEDASLCLQNPQLGDDTTGFERGWIIMQMVNDKIKNLWWEGARHQV